MEDLIITEQSSLTKRKRRRKIRNLATIDNYNLHNRFDVKLFLFLLIVPTISVYLTFNQDLVKSLLTYTNNHFEKLIYGEMNYCAKQFDTHKITKELNAKLLNQPGAKEIINKALIEHTTLTTISFIGGSGVGKTLASSLIQTNFQWPKNVFKLYISNRPEADDLQDILLKLSRCGQNLIIVDNLIDAHIIQYICDRLSTLVLRNYKIIIVFIFNVPTYSADDLMRLDHRVVELANVSAIQWPIHFNEITEEGLIDCIKNESQQRLNKTLDETQINNIVLGINVKQSGCKLVYSKVSVYM